MATSGTTAYVPLTDDVLTEAWERCGLSSATLTGEIARSAKRSLQLMLLDWSNRMAPLWAIENITTPTVIGTNAYTMPVGTVDVMELWVTDVSGNDLILNPVGRDEYAAIPNKSQQSRPTQYWVERARDSTIVHLWPTPERVYTVGINRFRLPQDVGGLGLSVDVPVLWAEAVASGLAARLALKYAPARYDMLKADAGEAYENAYIEERERVPFRVQPDMRGI